MWKPLEAIVDPGRFIRQHGVRGFIVRSATYPVRRLIETRSARAEQLYYSQALEQEAAKLPQPVDILFYPTRPPPCSYAITKMTALMGFRMVSEQTPNVRLAIAWLDETCVDIHPIPGLRCLNSGCRDISKEAVNRTFEVVFGYGFHVDPETHAGMLVDKADENFAHDGRIVQGPLVPAPGRVYQRVIDNHVDKRTVMDIRTPVIGNTIPFVYLKYRPTENRFGNRNTRVERCPTQDMFSAEEVSRIISFSRAMGLDYGELDILRDRTDGRIYIVDVNKTASGPPNHLPLSEGRRAMRELGEVFAQQFLCSTLINQAARQTS
ncbi:hypothetical protein AAII07_59015 [Microvirga sp. 0TCS3.31]